LPSRPAARRPGRRSRTRSGSGHSRAGAGCAGRCPWRSGSGPRTGPGGGAQFQVGELAGAGAGGKRGEPVPADVGEPQLRAGVRAFPADDDPHALRPGRQVQQAGELGNPRAVADLPVAVISRCPRPGRDLADGLLRIVGDGEPDRVGQPPAGLGEPVQELMRAAGVGADQHLPPRLLPQLRQCQVRGGDVVAGGVGAGISPGGARRPAAHPSRRPRGRRIPSAGGRRTSSSTSARPAACLSARSPAWRRRSARASLSPRPRFARSGPGAAGCGHGFGPAGQTVCRDQ
jgi:hypothetical protein